MDEMFPWVALPTGREAVWFMVAYALGCFTAGWYWVRWRTGRDLRLLGSGTLGARNAGRVLGAEGFLVTLALDAAKGAGAVAGARALELREPAVVACVLAVVAGHLWPAQLGLRGGKGVVVSLGALLAFDWMTAALLAAVFAIAIVVLRRFTRAGIAAFVLTPFSAAFADRGAPAATAAACLAALVVFAHRRDLRETADRARPEPIPMAAAGTTEETLADA